MTNEQRALWFAILLYSFTTNTASSSSSSTTTAPSKSASYTIISAQYGTGTNAINVTQELKTITQEKPYQSEETLAELKSLLGNDPYPDVAKTLTVTYQMADGEPKIKTIQATEIVSLP